MKKFPSQLITVSILLALFVTLVMAASTVAVQRIVIIGDSTVCNYGTNYYPQAGWGQLISKYFNSGTVTVINNAIGGRSSRSFYTDGHWVSTKQDLRAGDMLMIQFGHNDRDYSNATRYTDTNDYKMYLGKYITEARALGVHPVLVTPMNMNTWTNPTTVREVFCERSRGADYRGAMIRVGDSLRVPVLDLEKKSKALMDTMGQAYMARFHFLGLNVGEYTNFPNGSTDGTHFQELGALENARMVVEEISRQGSDSILSLLSDRVAPLYTVTVKTNYAAGKDTLTKTRRYPAGATVTLKVKPNLGTFVHWVDASGLVVSTARRHTFVQGTQASTFTAVFSQGTPIVISSAVSSSQIQPSSSAATPLSVLQAETFCKGEGAVESIHQGFNGSGYFNISNALNSAVSYALTTPAPLNTQIQIRYANGGTASRAMQLRLNGAANGTVLEFPVTGAWTTWSVLEVPIQLQGGRDSLVLISTQAEGGPNLDQIGFMNSGVSMGSCEAPVALKSQISFNDLQVKRQGSLLIFTGTRSQEVKALRIMNLRGQKLYHSLVTDSMVKTPELNAGLYILRIQGVGSEVSLLLHL